ncbi:type I restriction endonuclease subunit R [Desulfovibrio intestinalis]|uniref:Type I restriction enzyme R subunit n=1 Tax=Desulfovibrio intestinalis TaxID=58621 RepID=A0A7W8C4M7_9BACT|nr:DEAD/DEAH box helicase family protein [Desulfovibrio intestinalis]MBB5144324.1 type I restriction enzyme R subunit [Desulfovibrio intestinalis]
MPAMHTERRFEEAGERTLLAQGYVKRSARDYDADAALFPADVLAWVQNSQPKVWNALLKALGTEDNMAAQLLKALKDHLADSGSLHVLRHGFTCYGKKVSMAAFAPASGLNPETIALYKANICAVARQIPCKPGVGDTVDTVLAVNGIPVVTLELKNQMTGQTADNAKIQYENDRDPGAPLFRFNERPERTLAHFAVDTDVAWLCTRLKKKDTYWLPFNQGHHFGKGNPPSPTGLYRTAYLWHETLCRDSLLDLLARFIHLEVKRKKIVSGKAIKTITTENLIFPRYHQLAAVRQLTGHAREHGSGHNYLVQHSAGSGKSNTIGWLAHHLASLHNADNEKVFHSIIVVTDRVVIDKQLQDTIYQFDHKRGVVEKIDQNTRQLVEALASGVPIIISTIQKFPFIAASLERLTKEGHDVSLATKGKRFAVIIDEAHSSQSGETATELRRVLNRDGIEAVVAEQVLDTQDDESLSEDARAELFRELSARTRQPNLSYFAFTATPKYKTLAVFNEPGPSGFPPFHLYSMRQAIEENFIHDVLANYVPYKTYFSLVKAAADDPEVPKRKAARALARFVGLHPHNIRQHVEIIVEHFRSSTMHKIGGRAKAMVVTESRLHAVRYKLTLDAYLFEKGYTDVRTLVAFSGEVRDPDSGKSYTEPGMNKNIKEKELPERFETDEFNVLLVADKYQTGFDQPLLHTMYVDKKLGGVQAVQTLSRLNRRASGKSDNFVLDFRDQSADIYKAFKPYYEDAAMGEAPDPQRLYTLHRELLDSGIINNEEVQSFCAIWFSKRGDCTANHQKLNALIDLAVERFTGIAKKEQDLFRGKLGAFRNLYAFLSQIIPYGDSELEKIYAYSRFLLAKLPSEDGGAAFALDDEVALRFYRLEKLEEGKIRLDEGEADPLKGPTETGSSKGDETEVPLSTLVDALNERFGTAFTPADQFFFDQVAEAAAEDETLRRASKVNTLEAFGLVFADILERLFITRMEGNEGIFDRVMSDKNFRKTVEDQLVKEVYERLRRDIGAVA